MSKTDPPVHLDPMKAWRDWFVKNERDWSEQLTRVIKDDTVSRSLGQELNAALYQQQALTKSMAGPMAAMNLPTRDELMALAERFGRLEDSVARIEAALVQMQAGSTPAASKPPRTRKPPRAAKKATSKKATSS
jgi:hypothetical protein